MAPRLVNSLRSAIKGVATHHLETLELEEFLGEAGRWRFRSGNKGGIEVLFVAACPNSFREFTHQYLKRLSPRLCEYFHTYFNGRSDSLPRLLHNERGEHS